MLGSIAAVLAGLALLIWSADRFVEGAAAAARLLGISTLIIGIVVVGFGTSAPEIGGSVIAVLTESPGIAIGNALGSNIANIALILGISELVIGLTIVALGTSLPELAASIASLKKNVPDVAIGNMVGSKSVQLARGDRHPGAAGAVPRRTIGPGSGFTGGHRPDRRNDADVALSWRLAALRDAQQGHTVVRGFCHLPAVFVL